jgi:ribosomal protein S18 acetylase RimI-like enzyme
MASTSSESTRLRGRRSKTRLEALKTDPQAYGASYDENVKHPDSYWKQRLSDAADGTTSWLLFARQGECLVGMVGALALFSEGAARVIAVYVTPDTRGQGTSMRLMEALLDELRRHPSFKRVILSVIVEQVAAVALYRRLGFNVISENTTRLGDGNDHVDCEMAKTMV